MANNRLRWAVNVNQWSQCSSEWSKGMACIQQEERDRINEFVFSNDAALSLLGRLLLRAAITYLIGITSDNIIFGRTERARPYVIKPVIDYDVNVSHQGCYVVLAAEKNRKVGVDVMQLSRPRGIASLQQFFNTMDRQFTDTEWKQIQAPPTDNKKLALFYRHWCLKESYIKAVGIGLAHGLQRINFKLGDTIWGYNEGVCCDTVISVDNIQLTKKWILEESLLDKDHCVSVAVEQPKDEGSTPLPFEEIAISDLLSKLTQLRATNEYDWLLHTKRPIK